MDSVVPVYTWPLHPTLPYPPLTLYIKQDWLQNRWLPLRHWGDDSQRNLLDYSECLQFVGVETTGSVRARWIRT